MPWRTLGLTQFVPLGYANGSIGWDDSNQNNTCDPIATMIKVKQNCQVATFLAYLLLHCISGFKYLSSSFQVLGNISQLQHSQMCYFSVNQPTLLGLALTHTFHIWYYCIPPTAHPPITVSVSYHLLYQQRDRQLERTKRQRKRRCRASGIM